MFLPKGGIKYDFLCRQAYGNLLHKDYVKRGSPTKAFAALHAPGNSPVTLATKCVASELNFIQTIMLIQSTGVVENIASRFPRTFWLGRR